MSSPDSMWLVIKSGIFRKESMYLKIVNISKHTQYLITELEHLLAFFKRQNLSQTKTTVCS